MIDLSVIIVSYNTKKLTSTCIDSLLNSLYVTPLSWEVIIVDNNSTDGSVQMIEGFLSQKNVQFLQNEKNDGYGKANNRALKQAKGRYILYLNSDVVMNNRPFLHEEVSYMDTHSNVGALTVEVRLENGLIDPASHRGFPTLWRSFCYFAGLEKLTKNIPLLNRFFGGYHLTHSSLRTVHEIDSPTGAFFLVRKEVVDTLNGFDEAFFMYGEDLDLSFRIKRLGYQIIYRPVNNVVHYKSQSGLHTRDIAAQRRTRKFFFEAMLIFYNKHYQHIYPSYINSVVIWIIQYEINKYEKKSRN